MSSDTTSTTAPSCASMDNCPKRIALVSDFFYPNLGGVEMHIWSLAQCLHQLGHKVIIITHAYSAISKDTISDAKGNKTFAQKLNRTGVRYLPGPIKVYYCPFLTFVANDTLPTFLTSFPLLRWIFIRESINIVHSHQATSSMANESIVYAAELGIRSVYTDHSLFPLGDFATTLLSQTTKAALSTVGAAICVSQTCRDNLILRTALDPSQVHAIPNAVDTTKFVPDPSCRSKNRIVVVVLSRLVYRKGVDLLTKIIPQICHKHPEVDFLIGGDGPKKLELLEIVEREQLQERIAFLGAVPHSSVRDVLVQGHFFLNCSLTESFCIALLEATSCGLFPISTNVGGVPEVLPDDMIYLADPNISCLVNALSKAIRKNIVIEEVDGNIVDYKLTHDSFEFHERIKSMYSWMSVAQKTVKVYDKVIQIPNLTFLERLGRYRSFGKYSGIFISFIYMIIHFWTKIVAFWQPLENIDVVPDLINVEEKKITQNEKVN